MKKVLSYTFLSLFLLSGCNIEIQTSNSNSLDDLITKENIVPQKYLGESFKIANWNLQIFGKSKSSNSNLMQFYENTLENNYDIIFIQEIRDKSGESFDLLCSRFESYNCQISSRAGQSTSKEQVGILSKKGIDITITDYNYGIYQSQFNRPPIAVDITIGNYSFNVINIHTDPDLVPQEMGFLEEIILKNESEGNVLIIGDLNADCSYYNSAIQTHFDSWNWLIQDDEDTTLSKNNCSYDRIILNDDMSQEYLSHGIFRDGINKTHSDHYLIWGEFKIQ